MKKDIILVGASGRMGQEIEKIINSETEFRILYRVSSSFDNDAENRKSIQDIDLGGREPMVIDFSTAGIFGSVVNWCRENKVPLVSGTTGLSNEDFVNLENAGKTIPILWSSNMSVGINVLRKLISQLAVIKDFDFQVEDFHHNKKIDAPSGTAITLQNDLINVLDKDLPQVVSVRAGGIFGIHKINAVSNEEHIILEHRAMNRSVFANGAVFAAKWLKDKPAGCYSMMDALQ
ncbi:MAG: 4-hydroxy-tetrahydrodipicolinate reductase [Bdellovibrionales bacterium]|nr:4-hydroxy-tetrahydrodipicolinate reductase [Bdellovibrionales bacterium]